MGFTQYVIGFLDGLLEWFSSILNQSAGSYCQLETADDVNTLVARDGSLVSIIRFDGIRYLVGPEEFERIHELVTRSLQTGLSRSGHTVQVVFVYDTDAVSRDIKDMQKGAMETAERLGLELKDLFSERVDFLSKYCAKESVYFALWTRPRSLAGRQLDAAQKQKIKSIAQHKLPTSRYAQSIIARIPDLRDAHFSFVRSVLADMEHLGLHAELLEVHEALHCVRSTIDPNFTDKDWRPFLPGDPIPQRWHKNPIPNDASDVLWPSLSMQLFPRDGENLDLRTARLGDRIYSALFIDLFPQELRTFKELFSRVAAARIPWRMAFLIDSDGLENLSFKSAISAILSFAAQENGLINDSIKLLRAIKTNTDEAVVRLRVALATWAPENEPAVLRRRIAELAKAVQGWGYCEVSEISGDAFAGVLSSTLAVNAENVGTPSIAPFSDVSYMLPIARPCSSWRQGAVLFRSPEGKLWPYQPGSSLQTTWIDLIYARPGSGKSVLANMLNLGLCLLPGLQRLPRIAIIDIGPSSSGLISLLQEALPKDQRHYVSYHRLKMSPEYAINPFDTHLGMRFPTPLERAFLVNFLTLLATPVGSVQAYDGIADMSGMIVDELYKQTSDGVNPNLYTSGICEPVDRALESLHFRVDPHTTWWEITDTLFDNGEIHVAMLAQRYAVPILADAVAICRTAAVEDLYGKVIAPTGETLIQSFSRMISSSVREYPVLSRVTAFDLGEAKIVSLDLDEVAKTGGEAADRQTSIMYMLARYILAKDFYAISDVVSGSTERYKTYHQQREIETRDDPKRLVMDEFHRTAHAKAVREQVVVDMREGRKWKVQVALLSQSLDDFDPVMVDFATAIYIMDAGPQQAIDKSAKVFGLSETAKLALRTQVHGPRAGGGTFLVQYSTKYGVNTQLLTNTLGPIELWAFSTTAEDARVRNDLYFRLSPAVARKVLANLYPTGTIAPVIERRMTGLRQQGLLGEDSQAHVIETLIEEIVNEYQKNPALYH